MADWASNTAAICSLSDCQPYLKLDSATRDLHGSAQVRSRFDLDLSPQSAAHFTDQADR